MKHFNVSFSVCDKCADHIRPELTKVTITTGNLQKEQYSYPMQQEAILGTDNCIVCENRNEVWS